jgi:cobalamin biosynthesis Mg chelatase CobN
MKPHSIGRTLGIGLRVAGRIAGQRAAAAQATASEPASQQAAHAAAQSRAAQSRAAGQAAGQVTRGVARGVGGFLRPFGRVGGILWLEVTGVFFLLFALVFAWFLWENRASYAQGPQHGNFWISAVVTVLFLYLGLSSFWRARRK